MADNEDQILYEVTDKVAVITLNRPERANAQTMELLDDLNAAFERAAADDDDVRVIVLRGNGKHFSSGHDLSGSASRAVEAWPDKITLERIYALEARKYLGYSLSWRNIPARVREALPPDQPASRRSTVTSLPNGHASDARTAIVEQ